MKRLLTRIACATLFLLFAAAALAPFLANDLPLAARRDGIWVFPALRALGVVDFLWLSGVGAAVGLLMRGRSRIAILALAAAVLVWGVAGHRQRTEIGPVAWESAVYAPVRFGPTNTDFGAIYADVGAPGHPLGSGKLGRDVFARLLYGLRLSLAVGFAATLLATAIGVVLGAWAGLGGRIADGLASWIVQTSFCLPAVFVVAAAQSFVAMPLGWVILLLALLRFGSVARLTRQECLRVKTQGFVLSARGLGLHPMQVFIRHVLPNALIPATVAAAFGVAGAILAESGLSFLGLGIPDPMPSLGRMLFEGREAPQAPHLVFLPGLVILVVILSCHAIGAAVRDALDPRGAEATA